MVNMNCGIKNLAEMSHMFVQSEQGGCECCWILYKQTGLDGQMVESVASSAMMCQCLWMVAANDVPMFEKGVMMGRMFVSVCVVRWDKKRLRVWVKAFFMFLMMRSSGYARASKMCI